MGQTGLTRIKTSFEYVVNVAMVERQGEKEKKTAILFHPVGITYHMISCVINVQSTIVHCTCRLYPPQN